MVMIVMPAAAAAGRCLGALIVVMMVILAFAIGLVMMAAVFVII